MTLYIIAPFVLLIVVLIPIIMARNKSSKQAEKKETNKLQQDTSCVTVSDFARPYLSGDSTEEPTPLELEENTELSEIINRWKEEPDEWLIQAATEDFHEYTPETQEIIKSEIKRRGLENVEFGSVSTSEKTKEKEGDFFGLEKRGIQKGVIGGLIMIFVAVVWFFGGLVGGVIFYYPPILFLIGIYALLKGIFTGNISGKKLEEVNSNKDNVGDILYSRNIGAFTKTSGSAIASFILAILSPFTCIITSIPAIILGIVALVKINKSAGQLKGKGLAIAGIAVPVVCWMLIIVLIILLPGLTPGWRSYQKGLEALHSGNYDVAITCFTEAIRANPRNASAYNNRGFAYCGKGEYDLAIADCTEAIRLDPKLFAAFMERGVAYYRKGNYDQVLADFTEAIRLAPNYPPAYSERGSTYSRKGEYDKAITDCTKALELDPKFTTAYISRSDAYIEKGEFDKAFADLERAIKLSPDASCYGWRALAHFRKGDVDAAIRDYDTAIGLTPDNASYVSDRGWAAFKEEFATAIDLEKASYLSGRGWAYISKGEIDKALGDLNRAVELSPEARCYDTRAWAFFHIGDLASAERDVRKAMALEPKYVWPQVLLFRIESAQGNHAEAVKLACQFLSTAPVDAEAKSTHLVLRYFLGKVSLETLQKHARWSNYQVVVRGYTPYLTTPKTLSLLLQAVDKDTGQVTINGGDSCHPTEPFTWDWGDAYNRNREHDKAIADYNEAIRLDPELEFVYYNRGYAYYGRGEYNFAITDQSKAIRRDPENALPYIGRGAAYIEKAEYDKAIADYNEAIRLDPNNAFAYYMQAIAYYDKGEYDKVSEDVNKAQSLGFKFPPEILKSLREAKGREK